MQVDLQLRENGLSLDECWNVLKAQTKRYRNVPLEELEDIGQNILISILMGKLDPSTPQYLINQFRYRVLDYLRSLKTTTLPELIQTPHHYEELLSIQSQLPEYFALEVMLLDYEYEEVVKESFSFIDARSLRNFRYIHRNVIRQCWPELSKPQ